MFVCLVLIGLTMDVVCVRVCVYYSGCVVSTPPPSLSNPFLSLHPTPTPQPLFAHTDTHTHANSHIPCKSCTLMECLKKSLRLSIFPLSESGGVISDRGLIINSIKWVWLPWQIGLGYNIIISASSHNGPRQSDESEGGWSDSGQELKQRLSLCQLANKNMTFCMQTTRWRTLCKKEQSTQTISIQYC